MKKTRGKRERPLSNTGMNTGYGDKPSHLATITFPFFFLDFCAILVFYLDSL